MHTMSDTRRSFRARKRPLLQRFQDMPRACEGSTFRPAQVINLSDTTGSETGEWVCEAGSFGKSIWEPPDLSGRLR